jgi:hypothetical protein
MREPPSRRPAAETFRLVSAERAYFCPTFVPDSRCAHVGAG